MSFSTEILKDDVHDGTRRIEVGVNQWHALHNELKADGFSRLEWLTAVHNLNDDFELISMVATENLAERIVVTSACTSDGTATICDVFPVAQFHEQEVRQLLGINFAGLTDGLAFDAPIDGQPLRRDFALQERVVKPWPGAVEPDASARRRPALPPGVFTEWSS